MGNILNCYKGDVILFCFRAGYLSWLQMSRPTIGIVIVNVLDAAFQFAELRSIFTLWGKYKAKKLLPPTTILLVIDSFLIIISHHDYQFVSLIFHNLKLMLQSIYSCFSFMLHFMNLKYLKRAARRVKVQGGYLTIWETKVSHKLSARQALNHQALQCQVVTLSRPGLHKTCWRYPSHSTLSQEQFSTFA
jgi:hypothetical protein